MWIEYNDQRIKAFRPGDWNNRAPPLSLAGAAPPIDATPRHHLGARDMPPFPPYATHLLTIQQLLDLDQVTTDQIVRAAKLKVEAIDGHHLLA